MSKSRHNLLIVLISALMLIAAACGQAPATSPEPAPTLAPLDEERTLTVGDLERSYHLHLPPGLSSDQPVPLVFVFHGFQMSASLIRTQSGMDQVANANVFIVVYPNGSGPSNSLSWNASGCCAYALENNVDDQAFIRQIIADVEAITPVDPDRVYAAGFSNGALLSFRLACEMSDVFAAVAPVAGVLVTDPCQPQEPVSIIQMHGMADTAVPYEGGQNPLAAVRFPPVEESLARWVQLNGCSGTPQVEQDGIVTRTTYDSCQPGITVELYALDHLGHSWPSQYITTPSMSEVIWEFFAAHPKP